MRKLFAIAVIAILAGLAPAAAIIGFCANDRCCAIKETALVNAREHSCCGPVLCFESADADAVNVVKTTSSTQPAGAQPVESSPEPAVVFVVPVAAPPDISPPPTIARLSILSVFVI